MAPARCPQCGAYKYICEKYDNCKPDPKQEKSPSDAPAWYSTAEAGAWADGYNTALRNLRE